MTKTAIRLALGLMFTLIGANLAPAAAVDPKVDSLGDLHWRFVGPYRAGWATMIEGVPDQPNLFFIATAGGGIWRSANAGLTWTSIFDNGPASVGALAVDPQNPNVIYAGTGQPEPRYDIGGGEGVFKSMDGGATWKSVGLKDSRHIGKIWIDPANREHVLVGALGHFFGPNDQRGVFASSDGGATWTQSLTIDSQTGVVDIAADPANPKVLFAAAWQIKQWPWQSHFMFVGGDSSAIYASTDGGATWARLSGGGWPKEALGRISLATGRHEGKLRVYATIDGGDQSGLWRSDDGGANWQRVNKERAFTGSYTSRIAIDPQNADIVYTIGQSIRRCTQGGSTCDIIKGAPGGDDYHHLWLNPKYPGHIASVSDQGTSISIDGGNTWSLWNNQPTGQFYHLATDNQFPYRIYSAQQDSGTVSIASRSDYGSIGLRDWHPVGADERDCVIPDPADPTIVYGTGLGGRLTRFDGRTGETTNIAPWPVPNYAKRQTTTRYHYAWITPLALSKVGPTAIYVGAEVLFRSLDRGKTWATISPDLTGKRANAPRCTDDVAIDDASACGYGSIFTIAPSPRQAAEIWVGTDNSHIQLTRDGGSHWTDVSPKDLKTFAKIAKVDVSGLVDGTAYAAADYQRLDDFSPHILATHDYGAHWRDIGQGLPQGHSVSAVRADPQRAGLLYAGTDAGVFVSYNDGDTWAPLQRNLPNAWVRDMEIHGDDLIIATQGRGIWILDQIGRLRQVAEGGSYATPHLFTPGIAYRVRDNNNRDTPEPREIPRGENPPAGAVIDYLLPKDATGPVTITIQDAKGRVVQRLTSEPEPSLPADLYFHASWLPKPAPLSTKVGAHRAVWNLRHTRPSAIRYEYSIAAAPDHGTIATPAGAYALPGQYTVTLEADGTKQRVPLTLLVDPRTRASTKELAEILTISKAVGATLGQDYRLFAEVSAIHKQAESLAKNATGDLATRLNDLAEETRPSAKGQWAGLLTVNETLVGMASDLETGDYGPTAPQRQVHDEMKTIVAKSAVAWKKMGEEKIAPLNIELTKAGLTPLTIPKDSTPSEIEDEDGDNLP